MTMDNTTINSSAPLTTEQINRIADQICNLAKSTEDMLDEGIGLHAEITPAYLVAMRAMMTNVGALADHIGGGQYRGDALDWMGVPSQ